MKFRQVYLSMNIRIFSVLLAFVCIAPAYSEAASIWSTQYVRIQSADFHSVNDELAPAWQGVMALKLETPVEWNTEAGCNPILVAIHNQDKHMVSAALTAVASDKQVKIYVDSTKQVAEDYCYVRALHILK